MFQVLFSFSISYGSFGFEALVENILQETAEWSEKSMRYVPDNKLETLFRIVLCLLFLVQLNINEANHQFGSHGNKSFAASKEFGSAKLDFVWKSLKS